MGKKYDAKNPNTRAEKTKATVSRVLKKDCRTCNNTGTVRVAPLRTDQSGRSKQRYYPPTSIKCPDC